MCIYKHVSTQTSNAYELFIDSHKYFTYDSLICSFTPMTSYVFFSLPELFVSSHFDNF